MLTLLGHDVSNSSKTDVYLLSVGPGPVDPPALGAAPEPLRGFEDIGRDDRFDLFGRNIHEHTVALTAARIIQVFRLGQLVSNQHLRKLRLEDPGADHLRLGSGGGELAIAGQKPAVLRGGDSGEFGVFRFGPQIETVIATEPQPPGEGSQHGVAEEARVGSIVHDSSRIAWNRFVSRES